MKKAFIATLVAVVFLLPSFSPSYAASQTVPVHLKAGKFFILYTAPGAPFVDKNNRLLIPLRSISDLFGAKVSYSNLEKAASLEWLGHSFQFKIGSKIAWVDGTESSMDTTPILKQGAMFLPIRLFLDHTDIKYIYDQNNQLLHITDEKILTGYEFTFFNDSDSNKDFQDGNIMLTSYTIERAKQSSKITIFAKNISKRVIKAGSADINPLAHFSDTISVDPYSRSSRPPLKEIKSGETSTITRTYGADLKYVISVARNK
ncbi:hypothetical protein J2Z22_002140 [Paenibacillus forsythiae]|uniref:Copper amine oxidase-like N-terminal domain-containing protein n=1 Tax=Paenibacillus forsythiae TaxID=365616 RepID=A0ABU3H718_9BACL|nr:copper amine oxidase N-terminal domain-containing protein [Paenibacillus forsythiae]MDT3426614.1 hypothetical protein [Paenibacillus forsythiae]